jgi:hypothetical protein
MSGGSPTFYKDGEEYPGGLFLGGAEDAVHGNSRAEREARTAHRLMVGGFVVTLVGEASAATGLALLVPAYPTAPRRDVGVGLIIGGLVGTITGLVLLMNAPPHMYDAINIYNDGVEASGSASVPVRRIPRLPASAGNTR